MKSLFYLKIIVMVGMLIGIIYSIRSMNAGKVQTAFEALGIQSGNHQNPGFQAANRPLQPGEENFNLCQTRVHAIAWSPERKVEEERDGLKLRWMAFDPQPRELNYMAIEKWLSAHCQVAVMPIPSPTVGYRPLITIQYIDGKDLKIEIGTDGTYLAQLEKPKVFSSQDLTDALKELEGIAQFSRSAR